MKETVLHYLWKFKKLKRQTFASVDGQVIEVIHPGTHNTNAGPDFLNAKVNINGIEWNGHVEIHINSSEWEKHKHQFDAAYNNVILHIVYKCDQAVFTHSGIELIQAEIKDLIDENDLNNTIDFISTKNSIACINQIRYVDSVTIRSQKERALFTRLESRYELIKIELEKSKNDWEQVTYKILAKAFGTNINKHAFERLAETVPLKILQKEGFSLARTEAILFNYSGLLNNSQSEYALELKEIAKQVDLKYQIKGLFKPEWKFSTMHANNFPTIRLAQFASMIFHTKNIFSKLIEANSIEEVKAVFEARASEYWDNHYNFNEAANNMRIKTTSAPFIDSLIINAVIPILFAYSKYSQNPDLTERCVEWLEGIAVEKNSIVEVFKKGGIETKTAFDSQALIELKNNFCTQKKCLNCGIGLKIVNRTS
jgi:hypothetical protein